MTFEERIDRLTERHEALAQSLELLTADAHANQHAIERLTGLHENLTGLHERLTDAMVQLATVVTNHERRIQGLEE